MTDISSRISELMPRLIEFRRDLHSEPELGFRESKTAAKVLSQLSDIPGIKVRTGLAATGIVVSLTGSKPGPCVALRADMDALPILEASGLPYASKNSGVMHACGHDGHTTALLGALLVLSEMRESISGEVRFLFQPAEEAGNGAEKMRDAGAIDGVDAIFGMHGWPEAPLGRIVCRPGPITASCTDFRVKVNGKGTHAASPHLGVDPLVAAAQIVVAAQSIVARSIDPLKSAVVTFGRIAAGEATNVIPEHAELAGTIRAFENEVREQVITRFECICRSVAAAYGAEAEVTIDRNCPPVLNDGRAAAYLRACAERELGKSEYTEDSLPSLGAEDFAFYLEKVPGAFWCIGLDDRGGKYPMLHNDKFDFNDRALPEAIRLHCRTALDFASSWRP